MTEDAAPTLEPTEDAPSRDDLKKALKAFRKRLKLMRLDEESSNTMGGLSAGRRSGIVAIQPPREWPKLVWEILASEGRLQRAGQGMYKLPED